MFEIAINSSWSQRVGCSLPPTQKKHEGRTSRRRKNRLCKVILWFCCYCGHGGMTQRAPGCVVCNVPRCGRCEWEKVELPLGGQGHGLYTWAKHAALCTDAALLDLTAPEPHTLPPPDLRDVTTTVTCTTVEPDPACVDNGFQERQKSIPLPGHATRQSLNECSLHEQVHTLYSSTSKPPLEFGLSSLSLNQANVISDPSVSNRALDSSTVLPHGTGVLDQILVAFDTWRADGRNGSNASSSTSTTTPSSGHPNASTQPKQSRKRSASHGLLSRQGGAKRAKVSIDQAHQAGQRNKRLLACPFWKKDPIRHRDCFKGVKRIRDVKQHLRRSHVRPIFCPRCGMEFGDEESELRIHMRAVQQCDNREFIEPDGITASHQKNLNRYSDRSADEAEQWYVIWDYLFPGGPNGMPAARRPTSPYVDEDLSEDLLAFREFSRSDGWGTLANDPSLSYAALQIDEELLQRCLDRIYENFLARRSTTSQEMWEESPNAFSDSSTPDESAPTSDTTSIDHQILDNGLMTMSHFSTDLDFGDNFFCPQIDGAFDNLMAMPSVDITTAQAFPSVPLLTSEQGAEHTIQVATLDPALISR